MSDLTVILSGPDAERGALVNRLTRAGCDTSAHPSSTHNYGLTSEDEHTWLTCLASSLDPVEKALERSPKWALRMHWNTPPCRVCRGQGKAVGGVNCTHCLGVGKTNKRPPEINPLQDLRDELAALRERIQELEGGR